MLLNVIQIMIICMQGSAGLELIAGSEPWDRFHFPDTSAHYSSKSLTAFWQTVEVYGWHQLTKTITKQKVFTPVSGDCTYEGQREYQNHNWLWRFKKKILLHKLKGVYRSFGASDLISQKHFWFPCHEKAFALTLLSLAGTPKYWILHTPMKPFLLFKKILHKPCLFQGEYGEALINKWERPLCAIKSHTHFLLALHCDKPSASPVLPFVYLAQLSWN